MIVSRPNKSTATSSAVVELIQKVSTIPLGRGVSGIVRDIVSGGASAQGDVSWVTLGIA